MACRVTDTRRTLGAQGLETMLTARRCALSLEPPAMDHTLQAAGLQAVGCTRAPRSRVRRESDASAPAMLVDAATPVLVTCEHAVRSRLAARLLAQAGFTRVYELAGGMAT